MSSTQFIGKDDLGYSIKDKIMYGESLKDDVETESFAKTILKKLNNFPDFVVQVNVNTGEKRTFAELKDRSIRCALWLKKQGIGKDDAVCTALPLHDDDYVPCLATLFIGAIFNPWSCRLSLPEARHFFSLMQPKIMFTWDGLIDLLVSAAKDAQVECKFVVLDKHSNYISLNDLMVEQNQAEVDGFCPVEPEEPKKQVGAIFFSSGTTGDPKGVMISYETLSRYRYNYPFAIYNMNILLYSTISWMSGFIYLRMCIRQKLTRILHSKFAPEETVDVMNKFKVRMAFFNTCAFHELCHSNVFNKYTLPHLETILIVGSKINSSFLEAARKALPNTFISNEYGLTEVDAALTCQTKSCNTIGSVGRILEGVQLKVVEPQSGLLCRADEEGELCFNSDNVMLGYFKSPDETKKVIDNEGWLHTGDLGFYDKNGEIWILDRIKHYITIQSNGLLVKRVSPSHIEEILLQHPGVADAAVVPLPHKVEIERPLAFVVKKPGAEVTADELKEWPVSYSEFFRLTGGVIFVDEIPYTPNKKNIKVLKEMAQAYIEK